MWIGENIIEKRKREKIEFDGEIGSIFGIP